MLDMWSLHLVAIVCACVIVKLVTVLLCTSTLSQIIGHFKFRDMVFQCITTQFVIATVCLSIRDLI